MLNPLLILVVAVVVSTLEVSEKVVPEGASLTGAIVVATAYIANALTLGRTYTSTFIVILLILSLVEYYEPPFSMVYVCIPDVVEYIIDTNGKLMFGGFVST